MTRGKLRPLIFFFCDFLKTIFQKKITETMELSLKEVSLKLVSGRVNTQKD